MHPGTPSTSPSLDTSAGVRAAYATHGAELYRFALRWLDDPGLAEEAVQDTFLRAWRSAPRYDPGAGAQVDANLVAHTWGTEIELVARGLAPGRTYTVTFIRSDGSRVPAGTFLGVADRPVLCDLNAALLRKDATSVVVTSGSAVVLRADL